MKRKVPLWGKPQGYAEVDTDATKGATLGVNVFRADGTIVTEADLVPPVAEEPVVTRTLWSLIAEIPTIVASLVGLSTDGWIRKDSAALSARELLAEDSAYDNTTSGLSATDVQDAIDELEAAIGGAGTNLKTTARLYDEGYLTAATMGWTVDAAGSAASALQNVAGMNGAYAFPSGASTSSRTGMIHAGFFCEVAGGEIRAFARLKPQHTPGASQQSQYAFGLKSGTGTTGTADYIHAIVDHTSGGWLLKWVCQATGTNGASVIPGSITGGTIQTLELIVAAAGGSVSFSINGTVVDTLTLPTGFIAMQPYLLSRKNGATGVSSTLWVDKVLVEQDR